MFSIENLNFTHLETLSTAGHSRKDIVGVHCAKHQAGAIPGFIAESVQDDRFDWITLWVPGGDILSWDLPAADDTAAGGAIQAAHADAGQVEHASLVFDLQ